MNATPAAAFVTVIALGISFAFAAAFGFWLVDRLTAHFARTEVEDTEPTGRVISHVTLRNAGDQS